MKISYKPGEDRSNPRLIALYAGNEIVVNCKVERAYRKEGGLTLKVEITDCEINRALERDIHTDIQEQPGIAEERADEREDQLPDSRDEGDAKKRDQLRSGKRKHRDKGKD